MATVVGLALLPGTVAPAASIAATKDLTLKAPQAVTAGADFTAKVKALDADGEPDPDYRGTVTLFADDPSETLPKSHRFRASDHGKFKFKHVSLNVAGDHLLTARDSRKAKIRDDAAMTVSAGPPASLTLMPPSSTIGPAAPVTSTADYGPLRATSQKYQAFALDAQGNQLGEVTSSTTFAIQGAGPCAGDTCSAPSPGQYTVVGTYGAAGGQASLEATSVDAAYAMDCRGENYDINASKADGCEQAQPNPGRTEQASARNLGSFSCEDATSAQNFSGRVLSDTRVHANPTVPGFDFNTGSAPDWNYLRASGGIGCTNDLDLTLTTTGGGATVCYRLTVITNVNTYTADVSGNGMATITEGSASYGSDTDIFFALTKTCPLPTAEVVDYTITGHL